jgi:transcriptional regulator with XRE-family HTH domain
MISSFREKPVKGVWSKIFSFADYSTKEYRQPWTENPELILMAVITTNRTPVNSKDERFFETLGSRLAQARKDQGLTQQQVADQLGIAQQTFAHYEGGRLRLPASMLPLLAQMLGLTVDELLGLNAKKGKRGPTPRLQQQIDRISELPKTKQTFVMEMLEMVLAQAQNGH